MSPFQIIIAATCALAAPEAVATQGLFERAQARIQAEDYAGALADIDAILGADPSNAAAYDYRALAHNRLGLYAEAARDATQALMIDPDDVAARDARAWALNRLDRFRDAMTDANHSLSLDPRDRYAYVNLSYAEQRLSGAVSGPDLASTVDPAVLFAKVATPRRIPGSLAAKPPPSPAPGSGGPHDSFWLVLGCSVSGGVLLALGFIQVRAGRKADPTRLRPRRLRAGSALQSGYRLGRPVGMGGMGIVYEAFDRALERPVAIKMIREEFRLDADSKRRFLEEARIVAGLHHPCIVDIFSILEDREGLYLVFEYVGGRTIEDMLAERGRLSLSEAKTIMRQACSALEYAHQHDVVHRDLKPANIMVAGDGRVKVMDFGISRHVAEAMQRLARCETVTGTPCYMAPEQEQGIVRKESDLFALGTCLYEMVTGRRAFDDPAGGARKRSGRIQPPSSLVPSLGPGFDALIASALDPDPGRRPPTARAFWEALRPLNGWESPEPPPIAPS